MKTKTRLAKTDEAANEAIKNAAEEINNPVEPTPGPVIADPPVETPEPIVDAPKTVVKKEPVSKSVPTKKPLKKRETIKLGEDYYRQKYRTVAGKLDKEVPALVQEVKTAKEERDALKAKVEQLEQKVVSAPMSNADHSEFRDEYGDAMTDGIQKLIDASLQPQVEQVLNEFRPLAQNVNALQDDRQVTAVERYNNLLDSQVPNWEVYGEQDSFLEWAQTTVDPLYGRDFFTILHEADESLNGRTAAAIFLKYEEQLGEAPSTPNRDDFLEPDTSGGAGGKPEQKPIFTREDYTKYSDDFRRGYFKGKLLKDTKVLAEAKQWEKEFFEAQLDGRVR